MYIDNSSSTNRPSFQSLMNDMKAGLFNMIVAYKIDRLTRSIVDQEAILSELLKYRCNFECVVEDINFKNQVE